MGNCNGTLPPFAVDTWEPFTTLRGSSVQVEGLRDLDDYAPGVLDLAAQEYARKAQPGVPAPPKKPKVAAGVCALPGCFSQVYGPGFDYCTATHAIQAGALAPNPAPFIPPGPPAWSPPALLPASPFQPPPFFPGLGCPFGGGAPPPFQFPALLPPAPFVPPPAPFVKPDPDGGPGNGGGGKGRGKGGKGKGRGGGKDGGGKGAGRVKGAALPQHCWAVQMEGLKASNALFPGSLPDRPTDRPGYVQLADTIPNSHAERRLVRRFSSGRFFRCPQILLFALNAASPRCGWGCYSSRSSGRL